MIEETRLFDKIDYGEPSDAFLAVGQPEEEPIVVTVRVQVILD